VPRRKSTHVDDPAAVGRRLREARERAGLSQRQLSFEGCSPAYISRIEAGERIPSLQLLREMGRRLGVSEDYLATGLERELGGEDRKLIDAEVTLRLGELDSAATQYDEVLEGATTATVRSRATAGLGQIAFERGEPRKAIDLLEQAVRIGGFEIADQPTLADTLGRAYATVDDFEPAIRIFRQALAAAEERKDTVEIVRFGVLLANGYIDTNELGAAEELLAETVDRAPNAADPLFRARIYWSQSRLYTMREEAATAARYARKALELLELTEHTQYAARAHHLLAHVELDRGNPDEALALLDRGLPLVEAGGDKVLIGEFRLEKARALVQLGRREEAAALATDSTALLSDVSPHDAGRGHAVVAEIFASLGDHERALTLYQRAAELLEAGPQRYLLDVYAKYADLLEIEGRTDEALEILKKAVAVQTRGGAAPARAAT
jgi:tetratricopeptide (TPR) repeat protein